MGQLIAIIKQTEGRISMSTFITNMINYMQNYLPMQSGFELFDTQAFLLLSSDTKAFAPVGRELIDVRPDISYVLLALLEQRMNIVGKRKPNARCDAYSRRYCQSPDDENVPHNRPGLGAHLQTVSVFVRLLP